MRWRRRQTDVGARWRYRETEVGARWRYRAPTGSVTDSQGGWDQDRVDRVDDTVAGEHVGDDDVGTVDGRTVNGREVTVEHPDLVGGDHGTGVTTAVGHVVQQDVLDLLRRQVGRIDDREQCVEGVMVGANTVYWPRELST